MTITITVPRRNTASSIDPAVQAQCDEFVENMISMSRQQTDVTIAPDGTKTTTIHGPLKNFSITANKVFTLKVFDEEITNDKEMAVEEEGGIQSTVVRSDDCYD